jgi:hypothetical protein
MRLVYLSIVCIALGGCSFALDESSGLFASAPGKYDFLDCRGLSNRTKAAAAREAELNGLMERSARGTFGPVVNTLVYRDEINSVRADQQALRKASDEKRCMPDLGPQNTSLEPMH